MSETEFKKDGTPKIYISCRAGCGLHKTKQIFRFHDCLGVQIWGHPLIPKTMFNGTRIKTTENWMCAKSQFRDSIINVTQEPVPIELTTLYEDTVPKPEVQVTVAKLPVPQADMRNALNEFKRAQAKRKREEQRRPSYLEQASKPKSQYKPGSHIGQYKKTGWQGTLALLVIKLININQS